MNEHRKMVGSIVGAADRLGVCEARKKVKLAEIKREALEAFHRKYLKALASGLRLTEDEYREALKEEEKKNGR